METKGRIHGRGVRDLYAVLKVLNAMPDQVAYAEDEPDGWSVRLTFFDITSPEDSWARAQRAIDAVDSVLGT